MRKIVWIVLYCLLVGQLTAKSTALIQHLEPTFWWTGMKQPELQLMVHGRNISQAEVSFTYSGVSLRRKEQTDNPDYLFLYLNISREALPGKFPILFKTSQKRQTIVYELKNRRSESAQRLSFTEADAIYLLMPDRFANGNPANDSVNGYVQGVHREDLSKRHGGDIDGIISKVPYLADLGITALWTTPLFDNNDTQYSYHHYACSDYYKIDPRFGKNEDYPRLAESCHNNGLKLIIDVVPNHCGSSHWWMKSMPAKDWLNTWSTYTSSNYRMTAWTDPHASAADLKRLSNGWFAPNMPDLNLNNKLLFDYLRQVYVFWIEYANIDGMRVDTYPYNDLKTAARFIQSIRDEYPKMNVVGECWVKSPAEIAYYQSGNNNKDGFDSRLTCVMDFVLKDVLCAAFNEKDGWDTGVSRFYAHYAQDFVYTNPNLIMNFLDNHDIDRYSTQAKGDLKKYKMALAMLVCSRGYPQIYYGTEIMIDGIAGSYEGDRFDFPGGWASDKRNAFTAEGRTEKENEVFQYLRTLLRYRKDNPVLQNGLMKQFIPENGLYVYFRYNHQKTIMVIANNNEEEKTLNTDRFDEVLSAPSSAQDIVSGEKVSIHPTITIPSKTVRILELIR